MAGRVPQDLDQLIAIIRHSLSGVGAAATGHAHPEYTTQSQFNIHAANSSAHHAPVTIGAGGLSAKLHVAGQTLTLAAIAHSDLAGRTPNDHHNQVHDLLGSDHTATGNAWDVVGLTAVNTPGLLTPSAAPGAAEKLLKTDENGRLHLTRLQADAVTNHFLPEFTDTYDLGSSTKLWRKGWLSELESVLFVENTVTAVGGWLMIPHGQGTLAADVGAADTTIDFGQAMTVNDFIVMRGNLQVEYLKVGSQVLGNVYNVTRNLDGSGANDWPAGQVFVVLGNSGDGRIEFDAQTAGPRISVVEQGATYNAQTERVRIGDMAGWGAYSGYGFGMGDPLGNRIAYTPATGLQIVGDGGGLTNINGGNIQTNTITATQIAANTITATQMNVSQLSAISANMGTITAGTITGSTIRTAASGARIEMNSTRIMGTNGTTTQWEALASTGKLTAGAGRIVLDADGISLTWGAETDLNSQIKWKNGSNAVVAKIIGTSASDLLVQSNTSLTLQASTSTVILNSTKLFAATPIESTGSIRTYSELLLGASGSTGFRNSLGTPQWNNGSTWRIVVTNPSGYTSSPPVILSSWVNPIANVTWTNANNGWKTLTGVPADVKYIICRVQANPAASGNYVRFGGSSSSGEYDLAVQYTGTNVSLTGIIRTNGNQIYADISGTINNIYIMVFGYGF